VGRTQVIWQSCKGCALTPPSRGQPQAGFAHLRLPLTSNVRPHMRLASVYRLDGKYFVHPHRKTTAGLWLAQPDFISLPLQALPEELGLTVQRALEQSHGTVPHPTDWIGQSRDRLAAAGVRSENAFVRSASLVTVSQSDTIVLESNHNGGTTFGFTPIHGRQLSISAGSSSQEVGAAVLEAFIACSGAA
jgi:hypothetical protein